MSNENSENSDSQKKEKGLLGKLEDAFKGKNPVDLKINDIEVNGEEEVKSSENLGDGSMGDDKEIPSTKEADIPQVPEPAFEDLPIEVKVKRLRLLLDEAMQYSSHTSGAKSLLYMSIFKSKSWLGKVLGELGQVNPYITEKRVASASQIPKTVDVFDNPKAIYDFNLKTELDKILDLRDLIADGVSKINTIKVTPEEKEKVQDVRLFSIALTQSYVHMCEARFELGLKLSQIRNK